MARGDDPALTRVRAAETGAAGVPAVAGAVSSAVLSSGGVQSVVVEAACVPALFLGLELGNGGAAGSRLLSGRGQRGATNAPARVY